MSQSRRQFLTVTAAASALSRTAIGADLQGDSSSTKEDVLPPPRYHLAMNLEIMFPRAMPYEERLEQVAACGAKHYGFWGHANKNLDRMLEVQQKHGLTCVSITGCPKTGGKGGLTKTGAEQEFLDDFEGACLVAKRFGADNLITFVGAVQKEIPWETQHSQIVVGLKKAGAIAEKHGVYLVLEPLNRIESPQMSMITSADAFQFATEAAHPHVKVDFDIYHRQLGEGNLLNTLSAGLKQGLIRFVEVGDVPGRKEPGSGEINYANIFKTLRRAGYAGAIGMEHGTTRTPQYAWDTVRSLAGLG